MTRKLSDERYDKIKSLLIMEGARSIKEISKKTGLHRNVVSRYLNSITWREKGFFRGKDGIMRIEPSWVEVASKLLPQIQNLAEKGHVLLTSRLTSEDYVMKDTPTGPIYVEKDTKSLMEGKTGGRKIGAVFLFTQPEMKNDVSSGIVSLHKREFLDENPYWLRDIFKYALREQMTDSIKKYFSGEKDIGDIKNEELDLLWSRLFGETRILMTTFLINPQELLEWIKAEGRDDLRNALPKDVCAEIYRLTSELWKQREKWDKKLKPLETLTN